jgi:hypothetical protein
MVRRVTTRRLLAPRRASRDNQGMNDAMNANENRRRIHRSEEVLNPILIMRRDDRAVMTHEASLSK